MTVMNRLMTVVVLILVFIAGTLQADGLDNGKLQGLGDTRYHLLQSEVLGRALHIYVRLPVSSEEAAGRSYPVLYLLDGGVNFPLISSYYHSLRFGEEVPEMILVGISYGSDTFEGGNYRSSDFTAPSQERAWWGKAPDFQRALEQELLPLVESRYAADAGRRMILGQSLGGQFVLFSALSKPGLFWGHIASNPALHRNLAYFLGWHGDGPMPLNQTRLFVAEGELNDHRFKTPAQEWIEFWSDPERDKPFVIEVQTLPGQTHLSAVTEAFRLGVPWLFSSTREAVSVVESVP